MQNANVFRQSGTENFKRTVSIIHGGIKLVGA
jgi:hypothetical protein